MLVLKQRLETAVGEVNEQHFYTAPYTHQRKISLNDDSSSEKKYR